MLKTFFVKNFDTIEKSKYNDFLRYMLDNSDEFSLVYFKYKESEPTKKSTYEIKKRLSPYKISAKNVNVMPSMITLNENGHIYRLTRYESSSEVEEILSSVDMLYDWDYPKYPMDLCFYKNGYCWFAVSSHEYWNAIYTNDNEIINDLEKIGLEIEYYGETKENELFYVNS